MNVNDHFTFRPINKNDRDLVHNWLAKPYVAKWFYGDGLANTLKGIDAFIEGVADMQYWLAFDRNRPFAFLITSLVKKPEDELSKWCIAKGATITLDMLIGEEDYLGRKLSDIVIREFLLSEFPEAEEVLIDPEASNSRAVHVYEKAGFKILGEFIPSHSPHPHYMMRLEMKKLKEGNSLGLPLQDSSKDSIIVRPYQEKDTEELAKIYYHTIHKINSRDYSKKQIDVWAPESSLQPERWLKKFQRTKPFVATANGKVVGFAELEQNGHIDCFYCHDEWIGKGVGSALLNAINERAAKYNLNKIFAEVLWPKNPVGFCLASFMRPSHEFAQMIA